MCLCCCICSMLVTLHTPPPHLTPEVNRYINTIGGCCRAFSLLLRYYVIIKEKWQHSETRSMCYLSTRKLSPHQLQIQRQSILGAGKGFYRTLYYLLTNLQLSELPWPHTHDPDTHLNCVTWTLDVKNPATLEVDRTTLLSEQHILDCGLHQDHQESNKHELKTNWRSVFLITVLYFIAHRKFLIIDGVFVALLREWREIMSIDEVQPAVQMASWRSDIVFICETHTYKQHVKEKWRIQVHACEHVHSRVCVCCEWKN